MPFAALEEDVLLRILFFCDISTVLAISSINKALRRIALFRQLWLSLVLDTRFRDALDLPPPSREKLECLSTEELIAVVKNVVTGPCLIGDSEHDESSSVTLTSVQIPLDDIEYRPNYKSRLLPGARYLLLHSTSTTQCMSYLYDVWSARRVWCRLVRSDKMCAVDLVPGGAVARVFFAQWVVHPNTYMLHVEEVDLTTGASHQLFTIRLASTFLRVRPCAIMGDFLLATVHYSCFNSAVLVLINWRASTFVSLGCNGCYHEQLISGYIVSSYRHSVYACTLTVTALEADSDHWQPLAQLESNLSVQLEARFALSIKMQERLEYNHRPLTPLSVLITPDALHAGAYNISVYGRQICERSPKSRTLMGRIGSLITMAARRGKASPEPVQALLSYRFTPEQGQASSKLRLVSARGVPDPLQTFHSPRAIPTLAGNSISVVYRQRRERTGANAAIQKVHDSMIDTIPSFAYPEC
ncbi:hypothetical protein MSAN_01529200 [Mycena sanguinolenta]|uniref:F-box domain-containing protein n=1 Tax=Mycena sanguinolenta TaxID=230812 RepID=A0A8H6Y689_9AGAR|nr:hypothetical protein MSAN_01529200 [Mycena sanguinolenta]